MLALTLKLEVGCQDEVPLDLIVGILELVAVEPDVVAAALQRLCREPHDGIQLAGKHPRAGKHGQALCDCRQ